jgi:hypothetical protein
MLRAKRISKIQVLANVWGIQTLSYDDLLKHISDSSDIVKKKFSLPLKNNCVTIIFNNLKF